MSESLKLALFGQPVEHSLSPEIHRAFARQLGLTVEYAAICADQETFPESWRAFVAAGGHGANITMPLKHLAMTVTDARDHSSEQAGAANTLVQKNDQWQAHNTDGWGLLADLDRLGIEIVNQNILILGAGGAVAGILGPLLARQPQQVTVANRTLSKAESLCQPYKSRRLNANPWQGIYELEQIDLLINATAMGHEGTAPQLPVAGLEPSGQIYDLNYGVAAGPLAGLCERKTLAYHAGLGMLVAQAARSFELWTDQLPDWSPVLEALATET